MQPLQIPSGDDKPPVGCFGCCCRRIVIARNAIFLVLCMAGLLRYAFYSVWFRGSLFISILTSPLGIYGAVALNRFLIITMIIIYFGWILFLMIYGFGPWYLGAYIVAFCLLPRVFFLTIVDYNRLPTVDSPV